MAAIRALLAAAFVGRFDDHDWDHARGGIHVVSEGDRGLLAHASVVPRTLHIGERCVEAGYVEAVATEPRHQGRGHGTAVMAEIARIIGEQYEVGALSTSSAGFYSRLGWELWAGPTFADTPTGRVRTADDDGGVLVLRTPATESVDRGVPIVCDWRLGDVW